MLVKISNKTTDYSQFEMNEEQEKDTSFFTADKDPNGTSGV